VAKREEGCGFPAKNRNGRGQTASLDEKVKTNSQFRISNYQWAVIIDNWSLPTTH
jgi:hypothetical protein